jgi:hypothetical protein
MDFPVPDGITLSVGDDVFFVGLFSQQPGRERNLPIARFGAISRMPVEPITVRRDETTEELTGYLVEARSWGGHSGSPVFWYSRIPKTEYVPAPRDPAFPSGLMPTFREYHLISLLGLVSAHFDIPQAAEVQGDILGHIETRLNAGIAVVTPANAISELLARSDVAAAGRDWLKADVEDDVLLAAELDPQEAANAKAPIADKLAALRRDDQLR